MTPPPGYELAHYDLTSSDEVVKLGAELGKEVAEQLMPAVKAMGMEQRVVFFPAFLGSITGHMCAAIGYEATLAVFDTLKMMAVGVGERNEKRQQ